MTRSTARDVAPKPKITATSSPDAIRKIRAALLDGELPDVYVNNGDLCHIERVSGTAAQAVDDDSPLPIQSSHLTGPLLALILAHHAELKMQGPNDGEKEWTPPNGVLSAVLSTSEWPDLDVLAGIVGTPVLRRDGTLLQREGYDKKTGLYLAPKVHLEPIEDRPSPEAVAAARAFILDELLNDFEWHDKADRANYLGLLVTPFLRRYLRCLSPLAVISATMPGSGKSILAALIGLLAGQKTLPWADDDHELRKAITSAFTVESGVVVFDNLDEGTIIGSPILANLLTNHTWSDRILGSTKLGSWANERLWMVTGNNLRFGGDIASRSVLVRLSPNAPHPEERHGFKLGDLESWIIQPANQARTLRHLLVLILDWVAAGARRDENLPNMRQFSSWARGVGGFLAHHDVPGFLSNLDDLRASDEEDQKWAAFLACWHRRLGGRLVRAREVFADWDPTEGRPDPWDGMFITGPRGNPPKNAVQLGQWITGHDGRYHGEYRLRGVRNNHSKVMEWRVEEFGNDTLV